MKASEAFEHELEIFRTESEAAAQFLYAYLSVHAAAGRHPSVVRLLNTAPLFWSTNLGALQTAAFIALGRIFDQAQTTSAAFWGLRKNIGKSSRLRLLRCGSRGNSATRPDWLYECLAKSYVPSLSDFRRLRKEVSKRRSIYEDKYRGIRHKVFAHMQVVDPAEVGALFAKTETRELRLLVRFTWSLYDALWQLYINGKKPLIRQRRYSVKAMRKHPTPKGQMQTVQERMAKEAARFLRAAQASAKGHRMCQSR